MYKLLKKEKIIAIFVLAAFSLMGFLMTGCGSDLEEPNSQNRNTGNIGETATVTIPIKSVADQREVGQIILAAQNIEVTATIIFAETSDGTIMLRATDVDGVILDDDVTNAMVSGSQTVVYGINEINFDQQVVFEFYQALDGQDFGQTPIAVAIY